MSDNQGCWFVVGNFKREISHGAQYTHVFSILCCSHGQQVICPMIHGSKTNKRMESPEKKIPTICRRQASARSTENRNSLVDIWLQIARVIAPHPTTTVVSELKRIKKKKKMPKLKESLGLASLSPNDFKWHSVK